MKERAFDHIRNYFTYYTGLAALIIFILITVNFNFTFSTDDFSYLARANSIEGLSLKSFGGYVSRLPVWAVFTWIGFKSHFYEQYHLAMYFHFALHIIASLLLLNYLLKLITPNINLKENWKEYIAITLPFILYPTHHEVLYWSTDFAYVWGFIFLSIGLNSKNNFLRIIYFILSFLTSEMFVFPLLAILFLESFIGKRLIKNASVFIITATIYFITRKFLGTIYGEYAVGEKLTFEVAKIISNIKTTIILMFGMHFYKTNYLLTLPYWLLLSFPSFYFFKDLYFKNKSKLVLISISIPMSYCFYWLMNYGATRALYGAQVFINSILCIIVMSFLVNYKNRLRYIVPTLIFFIFMAHNLYIFSNKNYNFKVLSNAQREIREELVKCNNTCVNQIQYKELPLKRDWVMHSDYWIHFVKWSSTTL